MHSTLLLLVILGYSTTTVLTLRSNYGESCNKTTRCISRAWLTCRDEVCSCTKQEEMIYDPARTKCVSRAGERCKYGIDESEESPLYETTDCVAHATCARDGSCTCSPDYMEDFNGTCTKRKEHGVSCVLDRECIESQYTTCINGKCQCNPALSYYSFSAKQCIGLATHGCINGKCTENAICKNGLCLCNANFYKGQDGNCRPKKGFQEECASKEECLTSLYGTCYDGRCGCDPSTSIYFSGYQYNMYGGQTMISQCVGLHGDDCINRYCTAKATCDHNLNVCSCQNGYAPTLRNTCGGGYDFDCRDSSNDCSDSYVCLEGVCKCKHTLHQVYSTANRTCQSIVSGPCAQSEDCIRNSFCDNGICKCSRGFVQNQKWTCDVAYGNECSYNDRSNRIRDLCDQYALLECRNRICQCNDDSRVYNPELRRCEGLVGSICSNGELTTACVENAECTSAYFNTSKNCKCKAGYSTTEYRTCVLIVADVEDEVEIEEL